MTDEEKKQKAEEAEKQKQELRRKRELENIEKEFQEQEQRELESVQKEIAKKKNKALQAKLISDKAFNVLLSETPEEEKGRIRRQYEVDDLSDGDIKIMLKRKYGYTDEELKRIFSLK